MAHDLDDLAAVALRAAAIGSEVVARRFGEHTSEAKGAGDYVTATDRESEAAIRAFLAEAVPEVPVLGEESGGGGGVRFWAVDPLDGTTNFVLGFPVVAVSVALVEEGRPVVAAVTAPLLGLAFSAVRGGGAFAGERRLGVSDRAPARAVVATAYPFRRKALLGRYLPALEGVIDRAEDIRRAGAAALDLAWTAAGVFDGYFELNLGVWDVAAGALLVQEAGGVVTDWSGGPGYLSGEVVAGSPATHAMLLEAIGAGARS
jgi:myo-inositol-1(or 4)-monophosphatase